jgi:putative heme transporter
VLPQFANYSEVWEAVKELSWGWIAVLVMTVALNIVSFAPPWMTALPGLRFLPALTVTQASTASTYLAPGGPAVGVGLSAAMLLGWGFRAGAVTLAVTLTGSGTSSRSSASPRSHSPC